MPGIPPISGISARNDSLPVLRHPKFFVLYTETDYKKFRPVRLASDSVSELSCSETRRGFFLKNRLTAILCFSNAQVEKFGQVLMPKNDRLFYLLNQLEKPDLILLLKNGLRSERIKLQDYSRKYLINLISEDLRAAAGSSVVNIFRDKHEFPYKRILIGVADTLTEGLFSRSRFRADDLHSEKEIENDIIRLFELKIENWWKNLKNSEKEKVVSQINQIIDANLVHSISQEKLSQRISKGALDSVITRGIITFVSGTLLNPVQWAVLVSTIAQITGIQMLVGGMGLTALGLTGPGVAVLLVPSAVLFLSGSNHKKTVPTVIMLLSKIHLKNASKDSLSSERLLT